MDREAASISQPLCDEQIRIVKNFSLFTRDEEEQREMCDQHSKTCVFNTLLLNEQWKHDSQISANSKM